MILVMLCGVWNTAMKVEWEVPQCFSPMGSSTSQYWNGSINVMVSEGSTITYEFITLKYGFFVRSHCIPLFQISTLTLLQEANKDKVDLTEEQHLTSSQAIRNACTAFKK